MPEISRTLPKMRGDLAVTLIPRDGFYANGLPKDIPLRYVIRTLWLELLLRIRFAFKGFWRGIQARGIFGTSRLYMSVLRRDGTIEHLGLVSTKVVTDAAVAYIVDDWDGGANTIDLFNFHGCGTGAAAEAASDTTLGAESTTVLAPDSTRATGAKSQPAANQMRTVGTVTFDGSAAITEHGVFTQAATGGGTLLDRSVFSVVNVANGDSIQFTYTLTLSSGG